MVRRKLKKFVIPTVYILSISAVFLSIILMGRALSNIFNKDYSYKYVIGAFLDNTISVVKIENEVVSKPYLSEEVKIIKNFYEKDADIATQEKALIYYENTYMQNSGTLYASKDEFDVVATLDGTVSNIKEDKILGKIVEITHTTNLTTVYQSLSETYVKIGDAIKQNDVIGLSGSNIIDTVNKNALLFEVYLKGIQINPEKYYEMDVKDLSE